MNITAALHLIKRYVTQLFYSAGKGARVRSGISSTRVIRAMVLRELSLRQQDHLKNGEEIAREENI